MYKRMNIIFSLKFLLIISLQFHFSYKSIGHVKTQPYVVRTGTSYIKKNSYRPIVKHSTTNLNVHTNLRGNNRVYYPTYHGGYGGYGIYGGYIGLHGGLGYYGYDHGGYGNGDVTIIDNDHFNQNIVNTDVSTVNNFNDNHEVSNFNDNHEISNFNDNVDVDVVNDSFNDDSVGGDSFSDDSFGDDSSSDGDSSY